MIKKAKKSNAKDIVDINTDCWLTNYKDILSKDILDKRVEESSERAKKWEEIIERDKSFYVLELDNDIIGFSSFGKTHYEDYKDYGEVYSIYFSPKYQGKGYGTKLFKYSIKKLKQDYKNVLVVTFKKSRAVDFYLKMGGTIIKEFDDEMYNKKIKMVMFEF